MAARHGHDTVDFRIRDDRQFLAGRLGQDLYSAKVLQQVEIIQCVGDVLANDTDTVVGHEHDLMITKLAGDAFAFSSVKHTAVELSVINDLAVELQGILGTPLQFAILDTSKC